MNLTLTAPHPYYPALGYVSLEVTLHNSVPGELLTGLGRRTVAELRQTGTWAPLAGEFALGGQFARAESALLVGLLWDLTGQPLHPSRGPRTAVNFAVVIGKGRAVTVYRPTVELRFSAGERADLFVDPNENLPDSRHHAA